MTQPEIVVEILANGEVHVSHSMVEPVGISVYIEDGSRIDYVDTGRVTPAAVREIHETWAHNQNQAQRDRRDWKETTDSLRRPA